MQDQRQPSTPAADAEQCAALALDLAPLLMRALREELSAHAAVELSVPQFRTLRFIARHPGGSLSDLAAYLGMTLPAASKLLDILLANSLVTRTTAPGDRRRAVLGLTDHGHEVLEQATQAAHTRIAEQLEALPPEELATCAHALTMLRDLFRAAPRPRPAPAP